MLPLHKISSSVSFPTSCVTLPCISTRSPAVCHSQRPVSLFLVSPQDLQRVSFPMSCVTLPCISTRSPAVCHSQCPVSLFLVSPQDLQQRVIPNVLCHSSLYLHKISSSVSFLNCPVSLFLVSPQDLQQCVIPNVLCHLPCISTRSPAVCHSQCPVSLFLVYPQDLQQCVIPNVLCHSSLYLHKISSSVSFHMSCVTLPCISSRSPAVCHSQHPVSIFLVPPQDLQQCVIPNVLCHSSLYLHKISSSVSFPMSCVTLPCISTRSPAACHSQCPVSLFLVSPQDLQQFVIPNVLCHSSLYLHKISSSVSFPMSCVTLPCISTRSPAVCHSQCPVSLFLVSPQYLQQCVIPNVLCHSSLYLHKISSSVSFPMSCVTLPCISTRSPAVCHSQCPVSLFLVSPQDLQQCVIPNVLCHSSLYLHKISSSVSFPMSCVTLPCISTRSPAVCHSQCPVSLFLVSPQDLQQCVIPNVLCHSSLYLHKISSSVSFPMSCVTLPCISTRSPAVCHSQCPVSLFLVSPQDLQQCVIPNVLCHSSLYLHKISSSVSFPMSCVTLPCISTRSPAVCHSQCPVSLFLVSPQDLQQCVIPNVLCHSSLYLHKISSSVSFPMSCVTLPCISTRSPAVCHSQCPVSLFLVSPQDLQQCVIPNVLCHSSLYLHKISSSVSFPMSCVTLPCISTRSPAVCHSQCPVSLFLVSPQDLQQCVIPNVLCHSSLYLHKISSSVSFPMSCVTLPCISTRSPAVCHSQRPVSLFLVSPQDLQQCVIPYVLCHSSLYLHKISSSVSFPMSCVTLPCISTRSPAVCHSQRPVSLFLVSPQDLQQCVIPNVLCHSSLYLHKISSSVSFPMSCVTLPCISTRSPAVCHSQRPVSLFLVSPQDLQQCVIPNVLCHSSLYLHKISSSVSFPTSCVTLPCISTRSPAVCHSQCPVSLFLVSPQDLQQ